MSEPILQARGLCKDFRDGDRVCHILRGLDLEVGRGEFVAVMGPSGCGKTTLLNILGLMWPPTGAACLRIDGTDCLQLPDRQRTALRREKIGFVFQRFNLLGTISAAGNIRLALRLRGVHGDGHVDEVLDSVGLAGFGHRKPGRLSIGEQQRVAIARAVACRPVLLLADEPTGNLDSDNARNVLDLFRRVHRDQGLTVVMITHNPECAAVADRVMRMMDGRFVTG
ncbi:MAG: ABC transporter ATP-binding protein [Planctomycetota bacterium]|jgi:putative ABC transport system ATP-binding protein